MIQNITPITKQSTIEEINSNFVAIQEEINSKQLSFHYLNLYNLKGSVVADTIAINNAYNLLNLNEALLIVANGEVSNIAYRQIELNSGDYLVKTPSGPVKVNGPTTGYYIPDVEETEEGAELTFTYATAEPESEDETKGPFNIRGNDGKGYAFQYTMRAGDSVEFPTIFDDDILIEPIIEIYHDDQRIDYPYSWSSNAGNIILELGDEWANEEFTVKVR